MSNYKTYALPIQPRARFVSLPQSDTLFGHLCWAIRYVEGEDALQRFLAEFADSPPLLLSAVFPQGMLPVPVLPPLTRQQTKTLADEQFNGDIVQATSELKARRDIKFLPLTQFSALAENLTNEALARAVLKVDAEPAWQETVIMRTAVDRITWSGREGALFDDHYHFFSPETRLTVWLRLRDDWDTDTNKAWLMQRWQDVARAGLGGRLSTGAGQFDIGAELEPADEQLPRVENANAFVTLSSFVPRTGDPTQGWWDYLVKRGKLGAHFSTNAAPGRDDPHVWKKPLVMFQPGSIFVTESAPRAWYGGLVPNIHPLDAYKSVVQYAYAFAVGVHVEGGAG
jgi:CRISPR-associated protein Csm4